MKRSSSSGHQRRQRFSRDRRKELLAAFERSGLSATAFARKHGLGCSTLHAWRRQARNGKPAPGFVQVELSEPSAPAELIVELGAGARLRISSADQIQWVAQLVERLNARQPC